MPELLEALVIRFPARSGYLSISRLNATAMAAGAGLDVDALDDLRLAIDEAVTWLVGDDTGPTEDDLVELVISCEPGRVEIRGVRSDPAVELAELDDLVQAILGATVDAYDAGRDADGRWFLTLTKLSGTDG